jgi:serine O-acetyltransferase
MGAFREDLRATLALTGRPTSGRGFAAAALGLVATNGGAQAVGMFRIASALHARGLRIPAKLVATAGIWLTGADLEPDATIAPGMTIHHPGGVVVHGDVRAGTRLRLQSGAVLGIRSDTPGVPVLGEGVAVGTGAKVLGPITVGDDVWIGANAVVVRDVPVGHLAIGVPATSSPRVVRALVQVA